MITGVLLAPGLFFLQYVCACECVYVLIYAQARYRLSITSSGSLLGCMHSCIFLLNVAADDMFHNECFSLYTMTLHQKQMSALTNDNNECETVKEPCRSLQVQTYHTDCAVLWKLWCKYWPVLWTNQCRLRHREETISYIFYPLATDIQKIDTLMSKKVFDRGGLHWHACRVGLSIHNLFLHLNI